VVRLDEVLRRVDLQFGDGSLKRELPQLVPADHLVGYYITRYLLVPSRRIELSQRLRPWHDTAGQ
jgi:hypothetical protein